jgi:hypothetical protein
MIFVQVRPVLRILLVAALIKCGFLWMHHATEVSDQVFGGICLLLAAVIAIDTARWVWAWAKAYAYGPGGL